MGLGLDVVGFSEVGSGFFVVGLGLDVVGFSEVGSGFFVVGLGSDVLGFSEVGVGSSLAIGEGLMICLRDRVTVSMTALEATSRVVMVSSSGVTSTVV